MFKLDLPLGGTTAGGGGLGTHVQFDVPFKFRFKNYIDDLGPILGLTNGNDRRDSSKWMRAISNTYDLTNDTQVKYPARISGDNYFYLSVNNLSEKGYTDNNTAVHDSNYSGHILSKILITMGSGEIMFNTYMGGAVGGKSTAMTFVPPIRYLDKIEIGIYRKLSDQESFTDLEKYIKKTKQVHMVMMLNKIDNSSLADVETGLQEQMIELISKRDGIPHLLIGRGNDKIRNEKWQFEVASIQSNADSGGYKVLMKIHSQRDVDFNRESSMNIPIDPSDIANYILDNIPVTVGTHSDFLYLKNVTKITGLVEMPMPPKGFDYLDINNVDYSMTISVTERI